MISKRRTCPLATTNSLSPLVQSHLALHVNCSVKGDGIKSSRNCQRGIRDETQQKVSDRRVVFCWICLMVGSSDLAGRLLRARGFGLGNSD
jgi:hypothetical protein